MSYFLSCNILADLALSTKASKILSGLIVSVNQPQTLLKDAPVAMSTCPVFVAQQGLYSSAVIHKLIGNNPIDNINYPLKTSGFDSISTFKERTVVHTGSQSNSNKLSLDNRSEWSELLITQLANINLKTDVANWIIWIDNRGYLCFQPTIKALSIWLKMLFDRSGLVAQYCDFSISTASDDLLHYIGLRCNQVLKLATPQVSPWVQGELNCTQTAELELIYGIIQVYDSLYMGAKYKIVAASKSLVEKFLAFDRTCRLLELDPHSPAFHERAGLITIVRSTIGDLLANRSIVEPE